MAQLLPWPEMVTIALGRIILAIAFLAVGLPWLVFPTRIDPESSPLVSRAIWMTFAATLLVHILAAISLYEAAFFTAICVVASLWARVLSRKAPERTTLRVRVVGVLYDMFDGWHWRPSLARLRQSLSRKRLPFWTVAGWTLVIVAVAFSCHLLFTELYSGPEPAFSDAPTNIAWLKYMENCDLYHDELYPRGMYAAMTLIRKFTALNAVVLLDACGPLIGLGILISILFYVYKSTHSVGAVLVAAILYGVVPRLLPLDLERHAGHQSEEYGLIFVLPAVWYTFSYLSRGRPTDRATAAAAAGVAAFTHPVPTLFAVLGMAASGIVALLHGGKAAWRRLPSLVAWVGGAGLVACLPLAVGMALGQHWHGASLSYLGVGMATRPAANPVHLDVLFGMAGLTLLLLLASWKFGERAAALGSAAAVAATGVLVYLLPHFGITSQALADRGTEFGAIGLAVAAAVAWSILERPLGRLRPAAVVPAALAGAMLLRIAPSAPAHPYHYFTSEMIELYLQADATYLPDTWTLVTGFRGYSLVVGRAFHMYPDEFVNMAVQMPEDLDEWFEASWTTLAGASNSSKTQYYVLLVERTSPLAPGEPASDATPILAQSATLAEWIAKERGVLPLRHIFSDANIDAWTIELPIPKSLNDPFSPPVNSPGG